MRSTVLSLLCAAFAPACSGAAQQPKIEDDARVLVPVPACVIPLAARKVQTGTLRSLRQEQYWSTVFSDFDTKNNSLPESPTACTGRRPFDDPEFRNARRIHAPGEPVTEEDILVGSGGDHLRVVWLKTHVAGGGEIMGVMALVRAKENAAEIYGVGPYKAHTARPYFVLERMGPEVVVTVQDEGCKGARPFTPCENTTTIFIPRQGRLVELAAFPVERRAFARGHERGAPGNIEYRLTSSVSYVAKGVRVFEQIVAKDPEGRELRRAELERVFDYREIELVGTEEPLWPRVFPGEAQRR
jgi:hypothetical protein